jgi:hypothetical protein
MQKDDEDMAIIESPALSSLYLSILSGSYIGGNKMVLNLEKGTFGEIMPGMQREIFPQSASRHLKTLAGAGWIAEERMADGKGHPRFKANEEKMLNTIKWCIATNNEFHAEGDQVPKQDLFAMFEDEEFDCFCTEFMKKAFAFESALGHETKSIHRGYLHEVLPRFLNRLASTRWGDLPSAADGKRRLKPKMDRYLENLWRALPDFTDFWSTELDAMIFDGP